MLASREAIVPVAVSEVLGARHGEYRRACPQCEKDGRDDALAILVDDHGVTWYCHRCHYTGGVNHGRESRIVAGIRARSDRPPTDVPLRWSERAEGIWCRTVAISGTIGEDYLRNRYCLTPPADGDLRFLPAQRAYPPRLVAKVTDFVTNEPMSLHLTKLLADGSGKAGTERDKLLLKGHQKKGGVIRLWPDESVTLSVALAEGIESALSAAQLHSPVWAAVDAGNLGDLAVVDGIETLVVFADHDEAGITAARKIVTRWRRAGRQASAWMPTAERTDPNDAVRGVA